MESGVTLSAGNKKMPAKTRAVHLVKKTRKARISASGPAMVRVKRGLEPPQLPH